MVFAGIQYGTKHYYYVFVKCVWRLLIYKYSLRLGPTKQYMAHIMDGSESWIVMHCALFVSRTIYLYIYFSFHTRYILFLGSLSFTACPHVPSTEKEERKHHRTRRVEEIESVREDRRKGTERNKDGV